ncbi:MAG: Uma2 family endonuclease [Dehalococcoidia bacterium]
MTTEAKRHLFTVDDFERLSELGFFETGVRHELLDGEIFEMAAILDAHAFCVDQFTERLPRLLDPSIRIRIQGPIRLGPRSEPLPDSTLARRPAGPAGERHPVPADILLVVEVSDSIYQRDRSLKLPIYAAAGIPEVWIVNLPARRIETYRSPSGDTYTETAAYGAGQQLSPARLPQLVVPVDAVLPAA